jgi:ParB family chromosome partitioning protein
MIRILELPKKILENVSRGTISVGQAKALLAIESEEEQLRLADRILSEKVTVRELEGITKVKNVPRGTKESDRDPYIEEIEEKLRLKYGTKVNVDYRKGRGSIRIEFYSDDELERILEDMF